MLRRSLFALALLCAVAEPSKAKVAPALLPIHQLWLANAVVAGKVTEIEKDLVQAAAYPGGPKSAHAIATVQVSETLLGVKGLTHVRIAFIPGPADNPDQLLQRNRYDPGGPLTADLEGCWFLVKHPGEDFYVRVNWGMRLLKQQQGYEDDVGRVRRAVRVIEDPMKALKSREAAERGFAAAVMVHKHRYHPQFSGGQFCEAEIAAEESRLILRGLTELEWGKLDSEGPFTLQQAWYLLNVSPKHGWQQPRIPGNQDANKVMDRAVKAWLNENESKFIIKRFVPADTSPKK